MVVTLILANLAEGFYQSSIPHIIAGLMESLQDYTKLVHGQATLGLFIYITFTPGDLISNYFALLATILR